VFAFTLTQLTSVLADRLSWLAVGQVLLIFGLLWWMYGGYAWLTNARPPEHTTERLLLLVGMAGFLLVGLATPRGFASYGVVLGLGYLIAVLVHACLFYRVNANILRIAPFNVASAILVIIAGLLHSPGGSASPVAYVLWLAALAIQLGSPLVAHPAGRFELRPSHYSERHSALLIVAIGESLAAVGIGAAGPASHARSVSWQMLAGALLGLAVAAALWWIVFGSGDERQAERVLAGVSSEKRTSLILNVLFYGNIPLLLGLVAMAAAVQRALVQATSQGGAGLDLGARTGQAAVLAAGAALFLTGDVIVRRMLRLGPFRLRLGAAVAVLATIPVGAAAGLEAQLLLVAALLVAPLIAERSAAAPGTQ
jgi:low temperature requirement protein LtrA